MQSHVKAAERAITVLVADDDPIFRQLAESRLLRTDATVVLAADGGEAWKLTRSHRLDMAIVDFEMPGLDGIALIRCLRSHPDTRHIPIILCTSREDCSALQAASEAGASSFLRKPINWSLFERHIENFLDLCKRSHDATKSLDEARAAIAAKDVEIAKLMGELDTLTRARDANGTYDANIVSQIRARLARFIETYKALSAGSAPLANMAQGTARAKSA
ncbi:MAG: response regulator [Hyphomicrobiaceae bacterium]|nr:response regulator [Hyphomicrobiaceae bacterium]